MNPLDLMTEHYWKMFTGAVLYLVFRLSRRPGSISSRGSVTFKSSVRKERRKLPDPPCVVCKGNGRGKCYHCHGRGRTNFVDLEVLPRGEWPKWCKTCGGSGLGYCSRCLGTGEYRYIMGFHFMRQEGDDP